MSLSNTSNMGFSGFISDYNVGQTNNIISAPNTYTYASANGHSADGYMYISDYLIQYSANQYPTVQGANSSFNLTFPTSFATTNNCVIATATGPNAPLISVSKAVSTTAFNVNIGQNGGNVSWIAIGQAPPASVTNFCNFTSLYQNTTKGSLPSDILSKLRIVTSPNTVRGHTTDGYIYIGNLLAQISMTPNITQGIATGVYAFTFPIAYSTVPYSIITCGVDTSGLGTSNISVVQNSGGSNITTTSFNVNIGGATGNLRWLSIGPA